MPDKCEIIKKKFNDIYKYFSHNLRTSTSTIVAMLEAIKDGLTEDAEEMIELVHEAGFLLDVFDKGMSTCSNYAVKEKLEGPDERINLKKLTEHFFSRLIMYEEAIIEIPDNIEINDKAFAFKNLYCILLHESLRTSNGFFKITGDKHHVTFECKDLFNGYLDICYLIKDIFNEINIDMIIDTNTITLRFN